MRDWSSIVDVGIGKEKDQFDMLVLKLEYRVMVPWADTILDLNGDSFIWNMYKITGDS